MGAIIKFVIIAVAYEENSALIKAKKIPIRFSVTATLVLTYSDLCSFNLKYS